MANYPESLVLTFQATMGFFAPRVIFLINRFDFQPKNPVNPHSVT